MAHRFQALCSSDYEAVALAGSYSTSDYYWPFGCKSCGSLFSKDLLNGKPIACTHCGSVDLIDYNIAHKDVPHDHTVYYGQCHQLKLDLILPGYKYPQACPSCGESELVFNAGVILN